jgi:hypothetical protein
MRIGERPAPAGPAQGSTSTRRALTRFALASVVVAVAVGIAGAVVSRRAAQTAATDDARTVTEVLAHSVIVPNLTDALVDGDAAAVRRMDQAVIGKVTTGSLVRVKFWTPEAGSSTATSTGSSGPATRWPWTSRRSCATTPWPPS